MAEENTEMGLDDDDFALAFEAAAVGDDTKVDDTKVDDTKVDDTKVDDTKVDDTKVDDTKVDDIKVDDTKVDDTKVDDTKVDDTKVDDTKVDDTKVEKTLIPTADEIAEQAAEKLRAENEAKKKVQEEKDAADKLTAEAAAREVPTKEEKAAFDDVKTNFKEIHSAFEAHQRILLAKVENILDAKLKGVFKKINERVTPTETAVSQVVQSDFKKAVLSEHKDAFDLLPKIEEWVLEQPDYLQDAYNAVLDRGTAENTNKLIKAFKDAKGISDDSSSTEEDKAAEERKKKEREDKLKAQESVSSRRTDKSTVIDPDDFEGAFNKFAT